MGVRMQTCIHTESSMHTLLNMCAHVCRLCHANLLDNSSMYSTPSCVLTCIFDTDTVPVFIHSQSHMHALAHAAASSLWCATPRREPVHVGRCVPCMCMRKDECTCRRSRRFVVRTGGVAPHRLYIANVRSTHPPQRRWQHTYTHKCTYRHGTHRHAHMHHMQTFMHNVYIHTESHMQTCKGRDTTHTRTHNTYARVAHRHMHTCRHSCTLCA